MVQSENDTYQSNVAEGILCDPSGPSSSDQHQLQGEEWHMRVERVDTNHYTRVLTADYAASGLERMRHDLQVVVRLL